MIIDTHFHLWDLSHPELRYSWLAPGARHPMLGDVEPLKLSHLVSEYLQVAQAGRVSKGVHIQCADPLPDPVIETAWLDGIADQYGFPHAIVAYADLADASAGDTLSRHAAYPRVRGVRDVDVSAAGVQRAKRSGLRLLSEHCLHYELRAVIHEAEETEAAIQTCRAIPDTLVVLTHAGLPLSRSREYLQQWQTQLARISEPENVVCKISGFGMGDYLSSRSHSSVTSADLAWACIEAFGPDRLMLGSNWPVETLSRSYTGTLTAYRAALAGLSPEERFAVTTGTAARVYRLTEEG